MKKFKFTLEKYLDMKTSDEDKLKKQLSDVNAKIAHINGEILDIEGKEDSQRQQYSKLCKKGISGSQLHEYSQYMGYLHQMKLELIVEVDKLYIKSDEYKGKLVVLSNEIKALNRMKQEQLQAYMKEMQAEETRQIDDFVSYKVFSSL